MSSDGNITNKIGFIITNKKGTVIGTELRTAQLIFSRKAPQINSVGQRQNSILK